MKTGKLLEQKFKLQVIAPFYNLNANSFKKIFKSVKIVVMFRLFTAEYG